MYVSKRISALTPSPTLALNAKAKELKAKGVDVLNFSVGEPDYPTPKPIVDIAIKALLAGHTTYGPAGGTLALRQAIADKLKRENKLDFPAKDVVCGIGAKEILFHLFLAILNEGDEVLVNAPAWVSYNEHIKAAGAIPVVVPMPDGNPHDIITTELLEKYATEKTTTFILCTPNNPAGYSLNREELQKIGNYLETKKWWVVSDEIYEYLNFESEHVSILETNPALKDRTIIVNGLSKSFAMTGWRVGYAAGPSKVIELVTTLQSHSSTCLPPFIEEAATWAVQQGKVLMSEEIAELKNKKDLAMRLADEIPNISYIKPQGAFYLFINLKTVLKNSTKFKDDDSMSFCQYLLEEFHMAAVPGEAFACPGYVRISYATSKPIIEEGLKRLKNAITKM